MVASHLIRKPNYWFRSWLFRDSLEPRDTRLLPALIFERSYAYRVTLFVQVDYAGLD